MAGDCCGAGAAGLGYGSLWAGESSARPRQPRDGSTQGMSRAHQTRTDCCHCRASGDGCHWAQLPEQPVSPSATFHGLMRWHFGHGMENGSPGWRDGHGLGACSLRQQMPCAFVLSSVDSARICLWAGRAVLNWSPWYPHKLGVTSLLQRREAEWVGLRDPAGHCQQQRTSHPFSSMWP